MRVFAQKPKQPRNRALADRARSSLTPSGPTLQLHPILLSLQRTIGNRAVHGILQAAAEDLSIELSAGPGWLGGHGPGAAHERQADTVAERVGSAAPGAAHRIVRKPKDGAANSPGGGAALREPTRRSMEERFGADFSGVRVHTDHAAAAMSESFQARAFTQGRNIYFNHGQYAPHSSEGSRLLAHELAHVVQQGHPAGPRGIQRKEIPGSFVDAARQRLPPQDWHSLHRVEWQHVSATGTERRLSPGNSFMRAAWHNTQNLLPGEYQTVNERHDYYDLISYVIEHDPGTPKAVRDVRFFHAVTAVTGSPGIGSVDKPIGHIKLGAETRQILRDINAELFALNMRVIRDLLASWKEPRDPQASGGRIGTFEFDIRMVETEQGVVESFIARNSARFTASVVQDIQATMDPTAFGQYFNFSARSFEWAIKALGVPKLDFTVRDHRQAIGFASVHIFHRKSEGDYLAFMKGRMPYRRPPNQYTVGNVGGVTLNDGLPGPLLTYDLPVGTIVEVVDWTHVMGPFLPGDVYAGKVNVVVLDGPHQGKTGWVDFTDLG